MKVLWVAKIPPKVKVFVWKLFQDRLPTRWQLALRGIISSPRDKVCVCVFCFRHEESIDHVMVNYSAAMGVWQKIKSWLQVSIPNEDECCNHFL